MLLGRAPIRLLPLVIAFGCTEEEDLGPAVQLGTGDEVFEPLEDGDEILIIQGPQGGFHLLGSARYSGIVPGDPDNVFDASNPTQHFQVSDGDTRVDASNPFAQGLYESEERGVYETVGRFVFLAIDADDELVGRTLTVTIEVADADGLALSDSVRVLAVPSPFNE